MGFDNECILNIQSLAGEYFCPVCRLLVYPSEAIQSQCTHLYCKPCLTYIVGTTRACPYDGYLVTEADSKPLIESNKALAETIGKIDVHCLYHRSGCTWQGQLSECTTHCAGCAFGDSPVVCNRCGTQIVHRQVQEHAQNCLGVQPQSQQAESGQDATAATGTTVAAEQNQAATTQTGTQTSQPQPTQVAAAPLSAPNQSQTNTISQPQAVPPQAVVPTPEQWYQQQQQYQQYYQQYLGYDPYQQQYQQYDMYQQQQVHQQYQQQIHPPHVVQGHHQPQMYMQPQPQSQSQPQPQPPVQAPALSQPQPQPQASTGPQPQVQAPVNPQHQIQPTAQPHSQMPPQNYPPSQGHQHHQLYPQPQPQPHPPQLQAQPHLQQRPQVPHQHQQPHPQVQQPHPQPQPQPQPRPISQPQLHPQTQLQHHPHMQPQPQPQPQPQLQGQHPSVHAVTGHQSYPLAQPPQQALPGAPQQHPMNMYPQQQSAPHQPPPQHIVQAQGQFPQQQQPPQMRPPPSHVIMQHQQQPPILPPLQQSVHPHVHQQSQPIPQHPPMHPLQQPVHQQQVHGHLQQHPQSFPGQTPGLVHNQPHQPGHFMQQPQQVVQTQLRPQGPPISLQQHQSQNHVVRPMMQSHGVPHHQPFQPSGGPPHGKPMQPSALQPSLNQTIPSKTNIRPQSSPGQQLGHSGTVLFPALAAPQSGTKTQVSSVQANIKVELEADVASQKTDAKEASGSDSVDLKIPKSEIDLKSVGGEEKSVNEDGSKNNQSNFDDKEILESSQAMERETASLVHENDSEEPVIKKETVTVVSEPLTAEIATKDTEQDGNSLQADKEIQDGVIKKNSPSQQTEVLEGKDAKMQKDAVMPIPGVDKGSLGVPQSFDSGPDRTGQNVIPQAQIPRQNIVPTHEKMLPQPGYQERNLPQPPFPRQGPVQMQGSSFVQSGNVAAAPDNNQHLPLYYGQPPPHMQDRAHQRPPVPDQMMHPSMPPPHQMQVPGQLPVHMRPQQQHILPGSLPPQGQPSVPPEHLRPPILNRPHSSFLPEVPPGGSFGRGPGPLRPPPPQGGFELQPTVPQGHHFQAHAPFVHGAGPRIQGDPGSGPPPGGFDSQAGMMPRGPPHGSEGIIGQSRPTNPMDDEMFANKRPGYFDGRQPDSFGQSSMQSNIIKMNGGPGKGLAGGVQDPSFPFGSQEERFKSLPEERYKQFPEEGFNPLAEERFKPFPVEPSRRIVDHREFEEDLKKFPRPGHLDSEHVGKFESYYSSSRPFDRVPPGFSHEVGPKLDGSASGAASRYLPPYQPGGLRPVGPLDDNMRRKTDSIGVHPDFLRNASEPGRHRMDGLPPLRSPGREYHSSRFGPPEDIDVRESHVFGERGVPFKLSSDGNAFHESRFPTLPGHLRRGELDGPGNLRMGEKVGSGALPVHFRSGEPHNLPSHLRMGEPAGFGAFPNHLRAGEVGGPRNLPSNLRIGDSIGGKLHGQVRMGEPEFNSSFPIHGYPNDSGFFNAGDVESFDQPRKRKSGTMGWCRICKVDCETVEGLDMHSQTREHQKMAMDMVLSIKKDNAKKQKLSSDDHLSHEDANKSRKASFESHGN